MFNRTDYVTVKDGPTYVTKTTTEYRAPTDESVRLLKEMEEKAQDYSNIIENNNILIYLSFYLYYFF